MIPAAAFACNVMDMRGRDGNEGPCEYSMTGKVAAFVPKALAGSMPSTSAHSQRLEQRAIRTAETARAVAEVVLDRALHGDEVDPLLAREREAHSADAQTGESNTAVRMAARRQEVQGAHTSADE